jgi:hypothetical protein
LFHLLARRLARREHMENLNQRNPEIDDTQTAQPAPNVTVIPEIMPGQLRAAIHKPREVIVAPAVGPRVNEKKQTKLKTKQDEKHRSQTLEPAPFRWVGLRRGLRFEGGLFAQAVTNISIC